MDKKGEGLDLLFRIIRRVCKDPWIKSTRYPITTFNYDTVLVSLKKFVVEENFPLRMHQFTMAVGHKRFIWALASYICSRKIFE